MNKYFVILAAGKSIRFNSKLPKQFSQYRGKMMIQHSIDKAIKSNLFDKVILVVNKSHKKYIKNVRTNKLIFINGGKRRQDSTFNALKFLKKYKPSKVFIHDAARPNFSINLLSKLSTQMKKSKGVIPYLTSNNSTKYKLINKTINLDRDKVMLTQTPQCFDFKTLYELFKLNNKNITDESTLFLDKNKKIKFIKGENNNYKITLKSDLGSSKYKNYFGIGFDIHKLVRNKKLFLGGIRIPYHSGLEGHSDGDVILHSITDAILGATGDKDIGTHYPSNKKKYKNIRSIKMLKPIVNNLNIKGFFINNIDLNLICEKPKVSFYRMKIIKSLSKILNVDKKIINLKGKTVEKLGLIGKEKAIACECIVSINKYE